MGGPTKSCLEQEIKINVGNHRTLVLDASEGPLTLVVRSMIHFMNDHTKQLYSGWLLAWDHALLPLG
jgi:hypothetical protein